MYSITKSLVGDASILQLRSLSKEYLDVNGHSSQFAHGSSWAEQKIGNSFHDTTLYLLHTTQVTLEMNMKVTKGSDKVVNSCHAIASSAYEKFDADYTAKRNYKLWGTLFTFTRYGSKSFGLSLHVWLRNRCMYICMCVFWRNGQGIKRNKC